MKPSMVCSAQPGHKTYERQTHTGGKPTVLSSKRYEGILARSRQDERRELLAAVEEEQRYRQYLKDGGDALCRQFTNVHSLQVTDEDTLQKKRDEVLASKTKDQRAKQLLAEQRKERIIRANQLLHNMKPGSRALQQALIHSEMIKQRKYNADVNEDIARNELEQQRLQDEQCPEILIPFGYVTEEQEKAEQREKSLAMRVDILKDLKERHQRRLDDRKHEIYDAAIEREHHRCRMATDDKAARELAASKRESNRQAYRDALKEKAEKAKFEELCEQIDERIRCVNRVAHRNMDMRYGKQVLDMRAMRIQDREEKAIKLCQLQQEKKRKGEAMQTAREELFEKTEQMDELERKCHREELVKQRQAYELEERERDIQKRLRTAEIRRFEMANRYKNEETNKRFFNAEQERQKKETKDIRDTLITQRQEFLNKRQKELMHVAACQEDGDLDDDVEFFDEAATLMQEAQKAGRPLHPIAKAVETYKRWNEVEIEAESRQICRNKSRDSCWPNFYSKAELAYKKYEDREKCRKENDHKRQKIYEDCLKISKLASAENPFKPCATGDFIECMKYKDMPNLQRPDTLKIPPSSTTQPEDAVSASYETVNPIETAVESKAQPEESIAPSRSAAGDDVAYKGFGNSGSRIGLSPAKSLVRMQTKLSSLSSTLTPNTQTQSELKRETYAKAHLPRAVDRHLGRAGHSPDSGMKTSDLQQYLLSKPQTMRKDIVRFSKATDQDNSALVKHKLFKKLPDLTCYMQKTPPPNRYLGVAELLAPDNDNTTSRQRCSKLPDLAQYWTPEVKKTTTARQEESSVLPTTDQKERTDSKSSWAESRKKTG